MKSFADLNITKSQRLQGDKIKISKVLNRQIIVHSYKVEPSKYEKNKSGCCLYLQIELDGIRHVIFTGSDVLIEQIKQVPESEFPFSTTICKTQEYFEFT